MAEVQAASRLQARYDRALDVLYLTIRSGKPARSREEEPGLVWRYAADDGEPIGVTIVDFGTYWTQRQSHLITLIVDHLAVPAADVRAALERQ